MIEKTFNKDNWSGESITLKIDEVPDRKNFILPGHGTFSLVLQPGGVHDETMDLDIYDILGYGGQKFGIVSEMTWRGKTEFEAVSGDISRLGDCLYSAAAKLLCNLI